MDAEIPRLKKVAEGMQAKMMVNVYLFLYMLLFEPFSLKSGDIFYFSVSVSFSLKVVCTSTNRENCVCSSKIFFLTSEIFHALSSYMERFLLQ